MYYAAITHDAVKFDAELDLDEFDSRASLPTFELQPLSEGLTSLAAAYSNETGFPVGRTALR